MHGLAEGRSLARRSGCGGGSGILPPLLGADAPDGRLARAALEGRKAIIDQVNAKNQPMEAAPPADDGAGMKDVDDFVLVPRFLKNCHGSKCCILIRSVQMSC